MAGSCNEIATGARNRGVIECPRGFTGVHVVSAKQSINNRCGIPSAVGALFITVAFALTLSPYLANADFGVLKVPDFQPVTLHLLEVLGPILLLTSILLNFPLFEQSTISPRSAGTTISANVLVLNLTKRYINVEWLDFDGKPRTDFRWTLIPGGKQEIETYVGHEFQVSDANSGEYLRGIMIKDGMTSVSIAK